MAKVSRTERNLLKPSFISLFCTLLNLAFFIAIPHTLERVFLLCTSCDLPSLALWSALLLMGTLPAFVVFGELICMSNIDCDSGSIVRVDIVRGATAIATRGHRSWRGRVCAHIWFWIRGRSHPGTSSQHARTRRHWPSPEPTTTPSSAHGKPQQCRGRA